MVSNEMRITFLFSPNPFDDFRKRIEFRINPKVLIIKILNSFLTLNPFDS